jgi:hypothetical protein
MAGDRRRSPGRHLDPLGCSAAVAAVVAAIASVISAVVAAVAPAADAVGDDGGCADDGRCAGDGSADDASAGCSCWAEWHVSLLR